MPTYEKSILPDKLQSFAYYKNKLPLFLQNSHGFLEHYKIWYDLLKNDNAHGVVDIGDLMLYLIDIFDDDYLTTLRDLEDSGSTSSDDYGTKSDILDKIGLLFGVSRAFKISYIDNNIAVYDKQIVLNNADFLTYIKCQIIKNYCEGTYKQINDYYKSAGLQVYLITAANPAECHLYLRKFDGSNEYSDNIKTLFRAGLLSIESMGISYKYILLNGYMIWDSTGNIETWDVGTWAE